MADANTTRKNHVFPVWLSGASQTLTHAATSIPTGTSMIFFNADLSTDAGNVALTLDDGTVPGALLKFEVLASGADTGDFFTVTITSAIDSDHDAIVFNAAAEEATLLWNGEAWIILSLVGATVS
jgi:hypothetical protein